MELLNIVNIGWLNSFYPKSNGYSSRIYAVSNIHSRRSHPAQYGETFDGPPTL